MYRVVDGGRGTQGCRLGAESQRLAHNLSQNYKSRFCMKLRGGHVPGCSE